MAKKNSTNITAMMLRKKIGEYLNRVHLYDEVIMIERNGKPMAALVSIEQLGTAGINPSQKQTPKLQPSIKGTGVLLGDLKEGSKKIGEMFKKSIDKTSRNL